MYVLPPRASTVLLLEYWKPVKGWDDYYEVSCTGIVRSSILRKNSYPGKVLKPSLNSRGYLTVGLHTKGIKKTYTVHSIVAEAFLISRYPGEMPVVRNHIDECQTNNRASNLEIVTQGDNVRHSKHKTSYARGSRAGNSSITEEKAKAIKYSDLGKSYLQVAKENSVSYMIVYQIRNGKSWNHI